MKIGVAFSGCDIGGTSAWHVLRELSDMGLEIGMVSACCTPAVTSLLYAQGCEDSAMQRLSEAFLRDCRELDMDSAVANLSADFKPGPNPRTSLAINAVNVSDGKIITFTDDYSLKSSNLKTFGLDDPYDALSATISLLDGLGSYRYEDCRLCDFCCWYGCPVHPLKLAGLQKIISIAFLPKSPKSPYEVLVKQMISASSSRADLHIPIEFGGDLPLEQYIEIASGEIKNRSDQILLKALF